MPVYNQSGFEITSAIISRRRFNNADENVQLEWDVLGAVLEVNLFESIFEPVMTGSVALVDSSALGASINFQGQEILDLSWRVGEKNYSKRFYIYTVTATNKDVSTQSSTMVLGIIERHGYLDQFKYLDRTSTGDVGSIIAELLGELGAGIDEIDQSDQVMRIMHNNRKPMGLVRWLCNRATTSKGEPMFCYSTLDKNTSDTNPEEPNIKFRSLGTMMEDHPWRGGEDFIYTVVPSSEEDRFMPEQYRIQAMDIPENDNIFDMANSGVLNSTYFNIDPFARRINSVNHDARTHLESRGVDTAGATGTQFDDNFYVDDENNPVSGMSSIFVSGINTTSLFSGDVHGYNEESDYTKHRNRLSRESDIMLLGKQRFSVTVPGFLFGYSDQERGVGTTVSLKVPKDQPAHTTDIYSLDYKRSGKFLIMNKRHIMKRVSAEYHVVLEVGRPQSDDNVNDPTRWNTDREQRPR